MNIRIGIFCFLFRIAVLSAFFYPTGIYGEERVHTVQNGETFYSIARGLGIKAEDLMKYNGITDPARLLAGQRLKIPGTLETRINDATPSGLVESTGTGGITNYRAVKGDTLYSISRKFSVTVEAIREANSLPVNYLLRVGDSLKIPTGTALSTGTAVQTGSTLPTETRVQVGASVVQNQAPQVKTPEEKNATAAPSLVSWPVAARELSYMSGKLSGVVITGIRAEPVYSLTWGTVLSAGPYRGFGKVVIIQVDGGYLYVYGGCESLSVKEGDRIGPGAEVGKLGIDAVSNKPQLFFMVYKGNAPVDPAKAPRA